VIFYEKKISGVEAFQPLWNALKEQDIKLDKQFFISMLSQEVNAIVSDVILEWD
jgi:hypothetical protein